MAAILLKYLLLLKIGKQRACKQIFLFLISNKHYHSVMSATKNNPSAAKTTPGGKAPATSRSEKKTASSGKLFLFDKKNYYIMFAGLALILLGFILMAGGKSTDPHVFNKEEIYSFRRITLAPILIIAGFVVEAIAIMRKPKEPAITQ